MAGSFPASRLHDRCGEFVGVAHGLRAGPIAVLVRLDDREVADAALFRAVGMEEEGDALKSQAVAGGRTHFLREHIAMERRQFVQQAIARFRFDGQWLAAGPIQVNGDHADGQASRFGFLIDGHGNRLVSPEGVLEDARYRLAVGRKFGFVSTGTSLASRRLRPGPGVFRSASGRVTSSRSSMSVQSACVSENALRVSSSISSKIVDGTKDRDTDWQWDGHEFFG